MTPQNAETKFDNLDRMFNPSSLAIVGVSSEGFGFGRAILLAHLAVGYAGRIYPVNPNGGSIRGLTIYPSIASIPEPIDFAIIAIPAHRVPEALEECRNKGAVGAEILSSGFREAGTAEGAALEGELQSIAARGIRVVGPNCFGIYCPKSGLTLVPGPDLSREAGPVAFVSQSGGLTIDFANVGKWRGIRFSKVISFGNGCDLRETEMLNYLRRDPDTGVICMYVEGVPDGREFMEALDAAAVRKPVVVIKGGLSDSGSRATASHTASLGGKKHIWEAALKQCNAVKVESLQEMADTALAFSLLPAREYKACSVVGGGGALGVMAADAAEACGLAIPPLRADIQKAIFDYLPQPGSSAVNPVDIANPFVRPKDLREVLMLASDDENIDIHIMVQLLYHYKTIKLTLGAQKLKDITPYRELPKICREVMDIRKKPVVLVLPNYKQEEDAMDIEEVIRETRRLFTEAGMPVYDDVTNALKAVAAVSGYYRRRAVREKAVQIG